MIEFNGYLTGATEEYFYKKTKKFGRWIVLIGLGLLLPGTLMLGIVGKMTLLLKIYFSIAVLLILYTFFPKSKKERLRYTPKRIYTDGVSITSISDIYADTKFIEDAKVIYDKGEFYDIVFPMGKYSEKFVCQKDLLSQGNLEDFEKLFDGKIIR